MTGLADLARLIGGNRYTTADERDLQDAIAEVLTGADVPFAREVRLSGRDRIDFLAARVGVEVKVAGRPTAVLRQLGRYAASGDVDALLLVTTRTAHRALPDTVGDKPLHVVAIRGAG